MKEVEDSKRRTKRPLPTQPTESNMKRKKRKIKVKR